MATILLIDDDGALRKLLIKILGMSAHTVLEAEDGKAGLEMFKSHKPNIVITDILMPDKDGIETIRELKACDPNVKILAISGGGRFQHGVFLETAATYGADLTLAKPFGVRAFNEALSRLVA